MESPEAALEDRLQTADALIAAARNKDDDGFALLWSKLSDKEQIGVLLVLAHIAGRESAPQT